MKLLKASLIKKLYLIVIISFFSLFVFVMYDLYRIKNILKTINPESTSTINEVIEPQGPSIVFNKPSKVCSYEYVLHEIINPINEDDNIQSNIGYQNNKVGLYIYAEVEKFTEIADDLINSNGGEWGYVLVPYNVKDRDESRWGNLFDRLSEKKLIPIIQLWDIETKDQEKIDKEIKGSTEFLNSLKWPIKYRYISAYNEMNDKNFWRGNIDPDGYAEILDKTITEFKNKNKNFFIMNGAFNSSARTNGSYMDIRDYMVLMNKSVPGIFQRLDGWASHPYPQPNFTGSPKDTGRDSIRSYIWELNLLKTLFNVDIKDLPVFITETGWPHKEGDQERNDYLDQYKVADNIRYAFEKIWLPDNRVVAITPFTIRYEPPFDNFSWINKEYAPYPQYHAIKDIKKIKGKPPVVEYIKSKVLECKYE